LAVAVCIAHYSFGRYIVYNYLAVDFFFILSGFILTKKYISCNDWKEFAIARFVRIFPLFWTALLFMLILTGTTNVLRLLTNISLTQMLGLNFEYEKLGIVIPSWSLSVEFWLNILVFFPLLILLKKHKMLIPVFAFLCFYLWGILFQSASLDQHFQKLFYTNFAVWRCFAGLLLGMLSYYIYEENIFKNFSKTFVNIVGIILFVIFVLIISGYGEKKLFILLSPFFIVFFADTRFVLNSLKNKYILIFARMSYAVYLFHMPFLELAKKTKYLGLTDYFYHSIIAFFLTIVLCVPIALVLEPYLIRKTKEILKRKFSAVDGHNIVGKN